MTLSDSGIRELRAWCHQFGAIAAALEQGWFRFSEDGRDVTMESAAKYRERIAYFEGLLGSAG
jgi:hypothetical protein